MRLQDILNYIPKGINPEVELVEYNNKYLPAEKFNVRSTKWAVLVNTTEGQVWLPMSAIKLTHNSGGHRYDFNKGSYYYDSYEMYVNGEVVYSVRTCFTYEQ